MTEVISEYKAIAKYEEFNIADIKDMVEEYKTIMVPEGDEDAFKVARKALSICIRTRTAIDKRRKQNGADLRDALAKVNADGYMLIDLVAPAEKHLKGQVEPEQERLKQIERDKRKAHLDKIDGWMTQAVKYGSQYGYDIISKMDDDEFAEHLSGIKETYALNQKMLAFQKKKEEAAAKKIADEQKAEADRLEKERLEFEEKQKAEQAERDRIVAEQQAALDKANAEIEAKQAAIDAKEAELKAKEDAEREKEAAELAEKEKERLEQEAAKRAEALKPEKQKCIDWVELIRGAIPTCPSLENDVLRILISKATHQIENILTNLHRDIEEL